MKLTEPGFFLWKIRVFLSAIAQRIRIDGATFNLDFSLKNPALLLQGLARCCVEQPDAGYRMEWSDTLLPKKVCLENGALDIWYNFAFELA